MRLMETKGDVRFYQNEEGVIFQQLFEETIEPVANGSIQYREIETDGGYRIRYELNGTCGFSVWSEEGVNYEDGFWTLEEARQYILRELPRACAGCGRSVYFETSPEWEMCSNCEDVFCSECIDWSASDEKEILCHVCSDPNVQYVGEGTVLVKQFCEKCGDSLRYNEYIDGHTCCEDCQSNN